MDLQTRFYLNCWKWKTGLSKKTFQNTNLSDKHLYSKACNKIIMNGGIYIAEGKAKNTWCAVYEDYTDDDFLDRVELVFDQKPTVEDVKFIQFLFSIEDFFSDPKQSPYVYYNQRKTHWTLLPFDSVEDKWEAYLSLRKKQKRFAKNQTEN